MAIFTGELGYNETVIEHSKGDKHWCISTGELRWINKINKYAKSRPDEVKIIAQNADGSICAYIPDSWVKISPKKQMSEEARAAASERLRKAREAKEQSY